MGGQEEKFFRGWLGRFVEHIKAIFRFLRRCGFRNTQKNEKYVERVYMAVNAVFSGVLFGLVHLTNMTKNPTDYKAARGAVPVVFTSVMGFVYPPGALHPGHGVGGFRTTSRPSWPRTSPRGSWSAHKAGHARPAGAVRAAAAVRSIRKTRCLLVAVLVLAGVGALYVMEGTPVRSPGDTLYRLRRRLLDASMARDYVVLDAEGPAWATASGAFPRTFRLRGKAAGAPGWSMACSGLLSCLNLYPTYALNTTAGLRGTLSEDVAVLEHAAYGLRMSDGTTLAAELDAVASVVSTTYTVAGAGGARAATIQKEMGGCSADGAAPGLSTCFTVCAAPAAASSPTKISLVAAVAIAVDQNHA